MKKSYNPNILIITLFQPSHSFLKITYNVKGMMKHRRNIVVALSTPLLVVVKIWYIPPGGRSRLPVTTLLSYAFSRDRLRFLWLSIMSCRTPPHLLDCVTHNSLRPRIKEAPLRELCVFVAQKHSFMSWSGLFPGKAGESKADLENSSSSSFSVSCVWLRIKQNLVVNLVTAVDSLLTSHFHVKAICIQTNVSSQWSESALTQLQTTVLSV